MNRRHPILLFFLAGIFLLPLTAAAQTPPDTTAFPDTLFVPSDTTAPAEAGLDTTISYSARSIEFFVPERRTVLRGEAQVRYRTMTLEAERIVVDWERNLITAEGVRDTLWADSARTEVDTVYVRGEPVFREGNQEIQGQRMTYSLKTRRGRITEGTTSYQDGYYWGGALKKDTSNVIYAGPGSFTTCSLEDPHYTFRARQMKLAVNDKVVAKPVVLYFGDVPVAAVPFGIFPSRPGRQSGVIIPTYGESALQGRFLRHLGYYYAPNEYLDGTGSLDYYEKSGFLFHGRGRYNWRYHLSGAVEGSLTRLNQGGTREQSWNLKMAHEQQIDPDTRFNVSANLASGRTYFQNYSFNLTEQLSQKLYSDATLTHSFPGGKNSISANLHHEQDLLTEEYTQDLPRVSFRRGTSALIPAPRRQPGDTTEARIPWYSTINYDYSGEYLHRRAVDRVIAAGDTNMVMDQRWAARHNLNFNSPQRVSYFTVNPSLRYSEQWFDETRDYSIVPAGVKAIGFAARRTFSTALSTSSKLYGYWVNPLPGVEAIRHTATPEFSLSFQPDFSDPEWGYYEQVTDSAGNVTRKDRFAGSLFGSTPRGRSFSLNTRLHNLFQMKYGSGEEQKKVDLFTLIFATGYNFAADSLRFAPLVTTLTARPISGQPLGPLKTLSFDVSTNHSFYKFGTLGEYDELYFEPRAGRVLRLRTVDISTSMGLSLGTLVHPPEETDYDQWQLSSTTGFQETTPDTLGGPGPLPAPSRPQLPDEWYLGQIPWDLQLTFHYTINRANPVNPSETFWMNANVDASLTRNWQIGYNTRVNLVDRKVETAGITIYRDLHCWEARLVWNPLGLGQGYFLRISLKSPQLQDVKVERRRGQGSFMGF
ncbi:MAG: LPS-assembly protein LptD [Candidatus Zixiibacteriota bacterium]|nr:MAG: LPS-assembly protein LptD [candidate division Zixibacteria bacterium]